MIDSLFKFHAKNQKILLSVEPFNHADGMFNWILTYLNWNETGILLPF